MLNRKKISILTTALTKIITYIKSDVNNINKEYFENIRDKFPSDYKNASRFYNTSNVNELIEYTINSLNKSSKELMNNAKSENERIVLENQYKSLSKLIQNSYENLNLENIMDIIDCVSDINTQKDNLKLIIKGLILLQIIYSINDIVSKTIENNNYNYIEEHKNTFFPEILEHIYEISSKNKFKNNQIYLIEDLKIFNNDFDNKIIPLEEVDEIKFNEDDLFNDEYKLNYNDNITYSSNDLDMYIYKIYQKSLYFIKDILDKIIVNNYNYLPDINFLMYLVIILSMHIVNKF